MDDKMKKVLISLICIGTFLTVFGFSMNFIISTSKKIKKHENINITNHIVNIDEENERIGNKIIENINQDRSLSEQEKGYGNIYASHYKLQNSMTKEDFRKTLKANDSNDNIVDNEIKTLIVYLNREIVLKNSDSCMYLSLINGENIANIKDNVFNLFYPIIAECMYDFKYIEVKDNENSGTKIMDNTSYTNLKKYFSDVSELKPYDDNWKNVANVSENDLFYKEAKDYIGKDYRIAYYLDDGYGVRGRFFELDGVTKSDDVNYKIEISIYYNNDGRYFKKTSKFNVEVVDKHLKYGKLVFE